MSKKLHTYPQPILVRHEIAPGLGHGPVRLHYRDDFLGHMFVSPSADRVPFYNCIKVSPESIIFPSPEGAVPTRKEKKKPKEKTTKPRSKRSFSLDDLLEA